MTEPPNPNDVAKRFLDLWQDQVARMATDADLAVGMRRWQAFWMGQQGAGTTRNDGRAPDGLQPGYAPREEAASSSQNAPGSAYYASAYDGAPFNDGPVYKGTARGDGGRSSRLTASGRAEDLRTDSGESRSAGSQTAAAVPGDGGDDMALILRELRRLEERIAALERSAPKHDAATSERERPAKSGAAKKRAKRKPDERGGASDRRAQGATGSARSGPDERKR